jgi:hypothetical protein
MKKIRIGNDFVFNWAIERGGLPEDLSSVLDAKLTVSVFRKKQDIPFTISWNIITIEFTPEICNIIGLYNLLFTYILHDNGLIDEDRKCAVDVDAFQIVARTAQADDPSEFTVTSDMAIAFKGDKGDSAYQVWLDAGNIGTEEDYFTYLRQPATDAGASISELEGEIQVSEGLRIQAESERVQAEVERQITIQEAVTATQEATTAASLADTARLAIQDDLELKANQTDLAQLESDVEQLAYVKIKNEVVNGNFENGLIGSFSKYDSFGGASTLTINSSTPISGNYDIRLTITTPATAPGRPILNGLYKIANIGDKIYIHFYAKISSGTPVIRGISDGVGVKTIYGGDVINGRNTRIIDVEGTGVDLGTIYFNSISAVWDMQMDNFMRINLTETFGAGNEPTQSEMNLLMDMLPVDYFEGEIAIPAQKIMQWQLKLIRKNKNAIIALGGTII